MLSVSGMAFPIGSLSSIRSVVAAIRNRDRRRRSSNTGDELHISAGTHAAPLCPFAPHPHVERRYLIVPGLRSSRIYIIDTKRIPRSRGS